MKEFVYLSCLVACCLLGIVSWLEYDRYEECYLRCEHKSLIHYKVLKSKMCQDDDTRNALNSAYGICTDSETALHKGMRGCALGLWWSEGEISLLYARIFKEPLMLYGLLLPLMLYMVKQIRGYCSDKRRDETFFREMKKREAQTKTLYLPPPPPPPLPPLPPPPPAYHILSPPSTQRKQTNWERRQYKNNTQL